MRVRRQHSLYLHSNAHISLGKSTKDTAKLSRDIFVDDVDNGENSLHSRDTVIIREHMVDMRAEMQIFKTPKPTPNLDNLSNLLYTRGCLQEMGCTFSDAGDLVTYGNPESLADFNQMLCLGPIYDEQWSIFFVNSQARVLEGDADVWPDMRTLKRVLENEGIAFGFRHRRLTHGESSFKIIRLCTAYDDLCKIWSAMHSIHVPTPIAEHEEDTSDPFDDSGCFLGEDEVQDDDQRDAMDQEWDTAQRTSGTRGNIPRNIGWRFSDDIDEVAVARFRNLMSEDLQQELEENLKVAMAVPLPTVQDDLTRPASPVQPDESAFSIPPIIDTALRSANHRRLRHGPSPLQNTTTPSMVLLGELVANPRGNNLDSLGLDATVMAAMAINRNAEDAIKVKPAKKKSFKGWWQGVLARKTEPLKENMASGGVSAWYIGG